MKLSSVDDHQLNPQVPHLMSAAPITVNNVWAPVFKRKKVYPFFLLLGRHGKKCVKIHSVSFSKKPTLRVFLLEAVNRY